MRAGDEKIRGEQTDLPVGTRAIAARGKVTPESLVEMARTTYDQAMDNKQFAAANGSIREIGGPGEFDHLTDDELLKALRERFARLGLATDAADTWH